MLLVLLVAQTTQGILQTTLINEQTGYLKIKIKDLEITNQTNTILHIIDPEEILNTITLIQTNIKHLQIENKDMIFKEIETIIAKIKSITPKEQRRFRRGLINVVGNVERWLFGTMDNEDREQIWNYLRISEENSHNAIDAINEQIKINKNFNESIETLKKTILDDREKILNTYNRIQNSISKIVKNQLFLDQMTKLRFIENKVNQIQDNVVSAKYNIIHPSILTLEELNEYEIDLHKLKLIKMGVLEYKNKFLIIAIKIPRNYVTVEQKLILPLPNDKHFEIDYENEYIIEINNKTFVYQNDVTVQQLKPSKHCILTKDCKLRHNNKTQIQIIDDETLIVKNAYKEKLKHNCDDREIVLNNNYLINFFNCQIYLLKEIFYNNKTIVQEKYFYPENNFNTSFKKTITFDDIVLNNFENIKEINELRFHKNISYVINISMIIMIICISVSITYFCNKMYNKTYNVKQVNYRIQENSYSNRGGVTYDIAATTMQPISAASAMKGQQHDQPKSAASANNGQQHFQPISAASAIKGQQLNHPLNAMSALKEYKSKVITDQRSPIIRM